MALLDIFKKKSAPKVAAKEKPKVQEVKPLKIKKEAVSTMPAKPKKISGQAYRILKKPHVTEKAGDLTAKNQYVFQVFPGSNKIQIKKAVEDVYGIDVIGVHIVNIHPKRRRLGRTEGWGGGYKKAIVRIKEGQKIEVLPR
ncbi:MAG: 50S ribosomal protein L23 [Candidatus Nealsonbacteria bacterium]|nr:50S ribosomal protein L23 [Candidatus Nealsonbacteria bacterium]